MEARPVHRGYKVRRQGRNARAAGIAECGRRTQCRLCAESAGGQGGQGYGRRLIVGKRNPSQSKDEWKRNRNNSS
jgi:hypothetical protein